MGTFSVLDYAIFIAYAFLILFVGLFVSRNKGTDKTSQDYFLASKSLAWWAIGSSIIASNISAEQFIGMSGSGFAIGMSLWQPRHLFLSRSFSCLSIFGQISIRCHSSWKFVTIKG